MSTPRPGETDEQRRIRLLAEDVVATLPPLTADQRTFLRDVFADERVRLSRREAS